MNFRTTLIILLFLPLIFSCGSCSKKNVLTRSEKNETPQTSDDDVLKIVFGSCNDEDKPQVLWKEISKENANLWLWMGDNIYGDSEDMAVMQRKYDKQNGHKEYQDFKSNIVINGVWDDHDYGLNDGGKEYVKKKESQQLFLDFIDVPSDDPRRKRAGTYGSQLIHWKDINVKMIYLDTRYFRDELVGRPGKYQANMKGTVLGKKQWTWLENELKKSNADIHIIASSIQFISEEHGYEKWSNFPKEREKLLDLLTMKNVKRPIVLSGDRHVAEISEQNWKGVEVCDITSSALTNPISSERYEVNKHRVAGDKMEFGKNYGVLEIKVEQDSTYITGKIKTSFNRMTIKHEIR